MTLFAVSGAYGLNLRNRVLMLQSGYHGEYGCFSGRSRNLRKTIAARDRYGNFRPIYYRRFFPIRLA